ncbi:MAG: hypothetical protein LBI71_04240 [Enterobacteriaceae bacterium]|jgi:hypothetical protein|nr:hypothetical protein [Enterobacteriaceae bacterium]
MKELNQVELEQVAGAGFWGDLFHALVHIAEAVVDSALDGLHKAGMISDDAYKAGEVIVHKAGDALDNKIHEDGWDN